MSNNFIINGITVQSVDTTSGIFIGINNVNNWSSFSKNNNGFGSLNSSQAYRNVNVVFDNDLVDFPVEKNFLKHLHANKEVKNDEICEIDTGKNDTVGPVKKRREIGKIDVEQINVNSLFTNAAISIGENILNYWSSHGKHNESNGKATGLTQYKLNTNIIIDNDVVDAIFK
ncbi:hypothetical protein [Lederbergia citri]|uniref:Uncharacterized protein n=1 Tax=Lederbergia citri TaxID=2833580 RepID=A0A942T9R9_9BACI|nr:hypothetical protein [Lederbergia citri]MBS4193740.1 hypothetical protein [Lederbergia citri]